MNTYELEVLVHYNNTNEPLPNIFGSEYWVAIQRLWDADVLSPTSPTEDYCFSHRSFALTEKGEAWLDMILEVPEPIGRTEWFDPRTELESTHSCTVIDGKIHHRIKTHLNRDLGIVGYFMSEDGINWTFQE